MDPVYGSDAFSPRQIAEKIEAGGVTKARLPLLSMAMLGVLAGGFIGLGGLFSVIVFSDPGLGFALGRILGGLAFSLGLILVVVAGAELFTGNNLLVMAWADRRITTAEMLRNWLIVYLANAVGAGGLALIVYLSNHGAMSGGAVALAYVKIAAAKTSLPFVEAFFKGALCNILVCLAVWLAMAGRSVADKVLAIVFPISAFVAAGFEHSVANMYLVPAGILMSASVTYGGALPDWAGLARNLVPVTLGNVFGGSVLVALVYFVIYRKGEERRD
jgi:formate transporter